MSKRTLSRITPTKRLTRIQSPPTTDAPPTDDSPKKRLAKVSESRSKPIKRSTKSSTKSPTKPPIQKEEIKPVEEKKKVSVKRKTTKSAIQEEEEEPIEEKKKVSVKRRGGKSRISSPVGGRERMALEYETVKMAPSKEKEWTKRLKVFLNSKLLNNIMEKEHIEYIVYEEPLSQKDVLKLRGNAIEELEGYVPLDDWKNVFTHESYDYNHGKNYEEYELIGDKVVGLEFVDFLIESYPTVDRNDLTLLNAYYMSKSFQPILADELDLPSFVRLGKGTTMDTHIKEDIFEAFFGGLFLICNKIFGRGVGEYYCARMMFNLFENRQLDFEVTKGSDKTRVKETFDKMGWGQHVPEDFDRNKMGEAIVTIRLTQQAMEDIRELEAPFTSSILGQGIAKNKKEAEKEAYKKALDTLINTIGLTDSFVDAYRFQKDSEEPQLTELANDTQDKLQSTEFTSAILKKRVTRSKAVFIELRGRRKDGTQQLLVTVGPYKGPLKEADLINAKATALEKYLSE